MDALQWLHRANAALVLIDFFVVTCIAAFTLLRGADRGRLLRILVIVVSALVGVQALLGISLAIGGRRPTTGWHFLVGPLTLFVLPLAGRLGSGRTPRAALTLLTAGAAAGLLLTLIAFGTGGGG